MVVYMLYSGLKFGMLYLKDKNYIEDQSQMDRMIDVADITLTFSYLLMLYGVSDSIRRSVNREVKQEEERKEGFSLDDFLITDDGSDGKESIKNQHRINNSE